MRLKLRALSRYRPRILTLIVFLSAAALIVLANLSFTEVSAGDGDVRHRSYGWPLIWHRVVLSCWQFLGYRAVGWYYSGLRLAANVALWLLMLAALTGTCEWLVRRYRPRFRWTLRTMLVLIALAALCCGWFTKARYRAAIQDPIIASMHGAYGTPLVFVERTGPKWLGLLGVDRYRRRIVLANYWTLGAAYPTNEQQFLQLSRLRDMRYLTHLDVDELTPAAATALREMRGLQALSIKLERLTPNLAAALKDLRQLRSLSIEMSYLQRQRNEVDDSEAQVCAEWMATVGKLPCLETLSLSNLPLREESLACLPDLKSLKSLHIDLWHGDWKGTLPHKPDPESCLRAIGAIAHLESLTLDLRFGASNESLAYLATLQSLKSLTLSHVKARLGGLAFLASLADLESLELNNVRAGNEDLQFLASARNLKMLILHEVVADSRPMLSHLPRLARLEALELSESKIDDDDLRCLSVLPRLKSLSLEEIGMRHTSLVTPAGLTTLGSIESLEELHLEGGIETPENIEALVAVKRLKRLNLGGNPSLVGDGRGTLILDDGRELTVRDPEGFSRVLSVLRKAKPGIVIEMYGLGAFRHPLRSNLPNLGDEAYPDFSSAGVPGPETAWMTPVERAGFEQAGGSATFDGASWPNRAGDRIITAKF